mmetsp:Transcript_20565/g.31334  ORF Transcript_20565/g.31334 Transcript_20565/m.31334 type:complete len:114 (+) Transcript_20565:4847-5188(+)
MAADPRVVLSRSRVSTGARTIEPPNFRILIDVELSFEISELAPTGKVATLLLADATKMVSGISSPIEVEVAGLVALGILLIEDVRLWQLLSLMLWLVLSILGRIAGRASDVGR